MKDNNNTNNCADNRFLPEESSAQKRTKSTKTTLPYPSYVVLYFICTTHVAGENLIKPHDNDYYMLWDTKAMCGKYDVDYLYYLFDTKNKVL